MSSFTSPLMVKKIGRSRRRRPEYELTESFEYHLHYIDYETFVRVPKGFVTDFASIPFGFRWLFPIRGKYDKAAVLHDYLYERGGNKQDRLRADNIFYEAMTVLEVARWRRELIWWFTRALGWRSFGRIERGKTVSNSELIVRNESYK